MEVRRIILRGQADLHQHSCPPQGRCGIVATQWLTELTTTDN